LDLTQYGGTEIPDLSSYWAPALKSTNLSPMPWISPDKVLVYYRNAGVDPDTIRPFLQAFSFRAGDPDATLSSPQPARVLDWSCVAPKPDGALSVVNSQSTIPLTCPKWRGPGMTNPYSLRLHVYFPNCIKFSTAVTVHGQWQPVDYAYAADIVSPPGVYTKYCADAGYDAVPQVQVGVRWLLTAGTGITTKVGDPSKWDLSSLKVASDDSAGQDDGVSAHADFMSGWSTAQLDTLMKTCFWSGTHTPAGTGPRNCGTIRADDPDNEY
jgi:hypothetical protein